jgi:dTDP-4-dehydrorhamnose reductase
MSSESNTNFLVIGSDGLLGRQLFSRLVEAGDSVWGTTRREVAARSRVIHLDLSDSSPRLSVPQTVHCAFMCAAVTGMEGCEADPVGTRHVNVTNTLRIAERLLEDGTFIQIVSTNAVFDGNTPFPGEQTPTCATTEYGRQKVEVEARLLDLDRGRGLVCVSRLSKVIAPAHATLRRFLEGLSERKRIEAFSDLALSPISVDYAVRSLIVAARTRLGGIFHFSGEEEMSYAALARAIALHVGVPDSLVTAVTARERGVVPPFCPAHPALGMARTREQLAISAEPLDQAVASLLLPSLSTACST